MCSRHGRRLAVGLFLLSPLVGEYLLGNQPITALPSLLVLAPMYGGGALLIRESARRAHRGWPTIVLLAAAYGLLEEGPIDQMLFNPAYLGLDSFAGLAPIPALGTSVELIQATLTLHTVWSICVPIALVEAFDRDGALARPWLGAPGLIVTAVVFVAGSTLLAVYQADDLDFVASPAQFAGCVVVIGALVVAAFAVRFGPRASRGGLAPRPWVVGWAAFAASGAYWAESELVPVGAVGQWLSAAWWFALVGATIAVGARWSRRDGWAAEHRLALAGGALLTYVWVGFTQAPFADGGSVALGNVAFGAGAILLLAVAFRALARREDGAVASEPARRRRPRPAWQRRLRREPD